MIIRVSHIWLGLLMSIAVIAQEGVELGGWIGTSHYYGDLNTTMQPSPARFAAGAIFRYNFDHRISLKSSINIARVTADDMNSRNTFERNRELSFSSSVIDWTNQIEFNFFHFEYGSDHENFTPYLFGGFSVFSFNPTKTLPDGNTYNLRLYGTEGQAIESEYGRFALAATMGMGIKWALDYHWAINIEAGIRLANTDYLDDTSGFYPDFAQLEEDRGAVAVLLSDPSGRAEPFRQRGNDQNNDSYLLFQVGLVHYFGGIKCPKIYR